MRAPLGGRGALLGDFGVGMGAALGGKPRRARIDALGAQRFPSGGATLDIDFIGRQAYAYGVGLALPESLLTFSGSGGSRFNEAGLWVPANTLRYDYDPISGVCKGVLIEEQRTNMLQQSNVFDNVYWVKTRSSAVPNAIVALDGTNTGYKLVEDTTATNNHYIGKNSGLTLVNGTTYTFSIPVMAAERKTLVMTWFGLAQGEAVFDLLNGNVFKNSAVANAGSVNLGGGRWLIWASWNYTGTGTGPIVILSTAVNPINSSAVSVYTGDGVSGAYLLGDAQLEVGAFPTSAIRTTTAQVTRTADLVDMLGNNFASWYNPERGTLYAECDFSAATAATLVNIASPASGTVERNQLRANTTNFQAVYAKGGAAQSASVGTLSLNAVAKLADAYAVNDLQFAANGALAPALTSLSPLYSPDRMIVGRLGSSNTEFTNGHIRRIRYYPTRLPNERLQAMTR